MKEEELMIGDLVSYDGTPMKVTELKFKGVSEERLVSLHSDSCIFRNITLDDRIQPIPLTPEILEKNGFVYDFDETISVADYYTVTVKGYSYYDVNVLVTYCNGEMSFVNESFCSIERPIEFVHEFQHALRLCNIDKEIQL